MAKDFPHLPPALPGIAKTIESRCGTICFYRSKPDDASADDRVPLLLVHSINAAGSAYEVRPLYEHYRAKRAVYAMDMPGFGFSERSDRRYTIKMMTEAIHAVVTEIRRSHGERPVDVLALSLSSEFAARAVTEQPEHYRSLALVSPTGFDARGPYLDPPGTTRAKPWLYRFLRFPLWDRGFYRLLTSRRGIRYFLEKTWGSKNIDEGMLDYDYLTTHQPNARFAPYYFVSGYLFSRDITRIYRALQLPVWMSHGVRGDFQDYTSAPAVTQNANWTVTKFNTGALPHFEIPDEFTRAFDGFLARAS